MHDVGHFVPLHDVPVLLQVPDIQGLIQILHLVEGLVGHPISTNNSASAGHFIESLNQMTTHLA